MQAKYLPQGFMPPVRPVMGHLSAFRPLIHDIVLSIVTLNHNQLPPDFNSELRLWHYVHSRHEQSEWSGNQRQVHSGELDWHAHQDDGHVRGNCQEGPVAAPSAWQDLEDADLKASASFQLLRKDDRTVGQARLVFLLHFVWSFKELLTTRNTIKNFYLNDF